MERGVGAPIGSTTRAASKDIPSLIIYLFNYLFIYLFTKPPTKPLGVSRRTRVAKSLTSYFGFKTVTVYIWIIAQKASTFDFGKPIRV